MRYNVTLTMIEYSIRRDICKYNLPHPKRPKPVIQKSGAEMEGSTHKIVRGPAYYSRDQEMNLLWKRQRIQRYVKYECDDLY